MKRLMKMGLSMAMAFAAFACSGARETAPAPEPPTLDVTHWTDQTELFMEYPPLVTGQRALFAVHLTRLGDFSAMMTGRPSIELAPASGGAPATLRGNEASRPGVFRVEGTLPAAGRYRWALLVDAPGLTDRHDLGAITVFPDEAAAMNDASQHAGEDPTSIAYLKEQQWTNGFATAVIQEADVRRALRVSAVVEPVTGGEAIVAAPAGGRFVSDTLPAIGTRVSAGQEIGRLQPRLGESGSDRASLVATVAEMEAAADAARAELMRAERLLVDRAVPARRVEDARRALGVADARLTAAQARLAQRDEALRTGGGGAAGNSFVLRAPIAGVVAEVFAALGASFDEGAPLFRIVRTDRVELQAHVPASDLPLGPTIDTIALEIPGRADAVVVDAAHMRYARILDPRTKALPVQFDVDNRAGLLFIGQTPTALLYTGARERMPVVHKDAVLTEGGRAYVFVQTGGESFNRRYIEVAAHEGDRVGVRSGLKPGERVVTRGAYDVQLASAASGLPAEGHVH
jgi:cobalt-zinc-cadmium efflux system membrane fusion protein